MAKPHTRVPPQDLEIERAVLGALMLNPGAIHEVADILSLDSMYSGVHRTVYDAMLSLHARSEPIDVVTVSAKLKERQELKGIGGAGFLNELVSTAASPGSARHYAQMVQSKFILRQLIDAASKIGELGFAEDRIIEEVL